MTCKYFSILLFAVSILSCKKDPATPTEKYIVSASKMINLTGGNWGDVEPQLNGKIGYKYEAAIPAASNVVKGEANLPAIDDSSKLDNGAIYLNIIPENIVKYAAYTTGPISQAAAYAMMLNYNSESLKTLTGIMSASGSIQENSIGANAKIDVIVARLKSGQAADRIDISYKMGGRGITYVIDVSKQSDGRYTFSYSGNW